MELDNFVRNHLKTLHLEYDSFLNHSNQTRPWKRNPSFREWLEEKGAIGKGFADQGTNKSSSTKTNLTRLKPGWLEAFEVVNLRMKTLLKVYLSKWFYIGLEYFEVELVLQLVNKRSFGLSCGELLTNKNLGTKRGLSLFSELYFLDRYGPLDLRGFYLPSLGNLPDFLYPRDQFDQIWKLRSFQSLRDYIFIPFRANYEHVGKKGIRKNRIRGYRDGKASPKDPTLTALARQLDTLFWSGEKEKVLDEFYSDVESLACFPNPNFGLRTQELLVSSDFENLSF